jgi:hypothetical protein
MDMKMESDNSNSISMIHCDPPTFDYPCNRLIQTILYDVDTSAESEDTFIDKFTDYIIIELQITKSAFWCYESSVFEKLIFDSEVYLISHSEQLSELTKKAITDCIYLLKFLATGQENLEAVPINFVQFERQDFCMSADKSMRIMEIFSNPFVKCPTCNNDFSQVALHVVRAMYAFKCPKCHQSISK